MACLVRKTALSSAGYSFSFRNLPPLFHNLVYLGYFGYWCILFRGLSLGDRRGLLCWHQAQEVLLHSLHMAVFCSVSKLLNPKCNQITDLPPLFGKSASSWGACVAISVGCDSGHESSACCAFIVQHHVHHS